MLEGLAIAREIENRERICSLLNNLGIVASNRGNYSAAETYYKKALDIAREIGHRERISFVLANLGWVTINAENYVQAQTYLQESLNVARRIGHNKAISFALMNLATIATHYGDFDQAEAYLEESLSMAHIMDHPWLISYIFTEWGKLHLKQHKLGTANAHFLKALETVQGKGMQERIADALYGLARVAAAQKNTIKARRYGWRSLTIFEAISHHKEAEVKQWLASLPPL